jgi:hypothetical protein
MCSKLVYFILIYIMPVFKLRLLVFKLKLQHFFTLNIVRTRTKHFEPEHLVCVRVHQLPEVQAHDPRTRTEPNPGQSSMSVDLARLFPMKPWI